MNRKVRKKYDKEFKTMVVNLCLSGRDSKDVALEMDLDKSMVRRWIREYKIYKENSFQGNGKAVMTPEQEEIARLKAELHQAQTERDILKKAVSIFSMSDRKNLNL